MQKKKTIQAPPEGRRRKIISITSIVLFILATIAIFIWIGKPMLQMVSDPAAFRNWVAEQGFWGKAIFVGMMVLQIVVAVIPGEPLEIAAGYAFGIWEGTLLCLIGAVIGSAIVFLFVKCVGIKAVEVFFPKEKIQSLKFLQNTQKLNMLVFILFFIPGTPKDVMTYFIGLTPMKLSTWLLITGIARIPSVITSTIGGDALGLQNYQFAVLVFIITLVISAAGLLVYKKICDHKHHQGEP